MSYETEERVIAIIRLIAMLGSSAAASAGFAVGADVLTVVLLCIAAVICITWGWWKNSNWTKAAQMAQRFLDEIKAQKEDKR